ncbi:MAG TPA: LysR substrate-binding domain-containing protein [Vicinamibacterales bacterium]
MQPWEQLPFSLRQLQYVVAVADRGGFRRAAEACGVAQPSLSAQVAQVEDGLGVQLFERGAGGVRVTAAGAGLIERARQLLIAAADFRQSAKQQADPMTATLRLGVIPTVCPYLLPDVAPALRQSFPRLHLVWREDKTHALTRDVQDGELDGAILALDATMSRFDHVTIGVDPFVVAAAPTHPIVRQRGPAPRRALDGATVLLLEDGHCFRDQALAVCGASGATEGEWRATGLSTLVQMVGSGAGVTLLPSLAVPIENRRGQLRTRKFKDPAPSRTLVLAWRKGAAHSRALTAIAARLAALWRRR